uniref:Transferrin receptor-like dimerisation domain-containing protein n=1 Tax=Biomphalaria glabrata TaxID=6526 RepID=A0A2C9KC74_BIOGL
MSINSTEPGHTNQSVYEVWKQRTARSSFSTTEPWINYLSGDQDHSPFMYRLGMSSVLAAFTYNMQAYPNLPTYPAHNTLQDTMSYVLDIDPNYSLHSSLVQILSDIVLQLADSAIIPINVTHYCHMMKQGLDSAKPVLEKYLSGNETDLLQSTISEFTQAALEFQSQIDSRNMSDLTEFDVLQINNKLIRISRAFIYEGGLLHQGQYRNVLIAPHPENLNEEVIFPVCALAFLPSKVMPLGYNQVLNVLIAPHPENLNEEVIFPGLSETEVVERTLLQRELVIVVIAIKRARDILMDDFGPDILDRDL